MDSIKGTDDFISERKIFETPKPEAMVTNCKEILCYHGGVCVHVEGV